MAGLYRMRVSAASESCHSARRHRRHPGPGNPDGQPRVPSRRGAPNRPAVVGGYRAWVTCVLSFKGRRQPVMRPGRYTELFFLDEATALAAGHRPCGECRRADYQRFKHAWTIGNPEHGISSSASRSSTSSSIGTASARTDARARTAPTSASFPMVFSWPAPNPSPRCWSGAARSGRGHPRAIPGRDPGRRGVRSPCSHRAQR